MKTKKIISILLSLILITGLFPMLVPAADEIEVSTAEEFLDAIANGETNIKITASFTLARQKSGISETLTNESGDFLPLIIPGGTHIYGTLNEYIGFRFPVQLAGNVTIENLGLVFSNITDYQRVIFMGGHELTLNNVKTSDESENIYDMSIYAGSFDFESDAPALGNNGHLYINAPNVGSTLSPNPSISSVYLSSNDITLPSTFKAYEITSSPTAGSNTTAMTVSQKTKIGQVYAAGAHITVNGEGIQSATTNFTTNSDTILTLENGVTQPLKGGLFKEINLSTGSTLDLTELEDEVSVIQLTGGGTIIRDGSGSVTITAYTGNTTLRGSIPSDGMVLLGSTQAPNDTNKFTLHTLTQEAGYDLSYENNTFVLVSNNIPPVFSHIPYIAHDGTEQICPDAYGVTRGSISLGDDDVEYWYLVNSHVTISDTITVYGDVHLILADGATLNALAGIETDTDASLTIYGQSGGTGSLIAGTIGREGVLEGNILPIGGSLTGILVCDNTDTPETTEDILVTIYGNVHVTNLITHFLAPNNTVIFTEGSSLILSRFIPLTIPLEPPLSQWMNHITGEGYIKIINEDGNVAEVYDTSGTRYNYVSGNLNYTTEPYSASAFLTWDVENKTLTIAPNTYIGNCHITLPPLSTISFSGNIYSDHVYVGESGGDLNIIGNGKFDCASVYTSGKLVIGNNVNFNTMGINAHSLVIRGNINAYSDEGIPIRLQGGGLVRENNGTLKASAPEGYGAVDLLLIAVEDATLPEESIFAKYISLGGGSLQNNLVPGIYTLGDLTALSFFHSVAEGDTVTPANQVNITAPVAVTVSGGGGSRKYKIEYYVNDTLYHKYTATYGSEEPISTYIHESGTGDFYCWSMDGRLYHPGNTFKVTKNTRFDAVFSILAVHNGYQYTIASPSTTGDKLNVETHDFIGNPRFAENVIMNLTEAEGGIIDSDITYVTEITPTNTYNAFPDTFTLSGVTVSEGDIVVIDNKEYLFIGLHEGMPMLVTTDGAVHILDRDALTPMTKDGTPLTIAYPEDSMLVLIGDKHYVLKYTGKYIDGANLYQKEYMYDTDGRVAGYLERTSEGIDVYLYNVGFQFELINNSGTYRYVPVYTPSIQANIVLTRRPNSDSNGRDYNALLFEVLEQSHKEGSFRFEDWTNENTHMLYLGNSSWYNGIFMSKSGGIVLQSGDASPSSETPMKPVFGTELTELELQGGPKDEYNRPDILMNGNASLYIKAADSIPTSASRDYGKLTSEAIVQRGTILWTGNGSGSTDRLAVPAGSRFMMENHSTVPSNPEWSVLPEASVFIIDSKGNLVGSVNPSGTDTTPIYASSSNYLLVTSTGVKEVSFSAMADLKFPRPNNNFSFNDTKLRIDIRDKHGIDGNKDAVALGKAVAVHANDSGDILNISDVMPTARSGGVEYIGVNIPASYSSPTASQSTDGKMSAQVLTVSGGIFTTSGNITLENITSGSPFFIASSSDFRTNTILLSGITLENEATEYRYNPFYDVYVGDWFYEEVLSAYEGGLVKGVEEHLFAPYDETTRGMFVTILYRIEGEPAAPKLNFTDVANGEYYTEAIAWANANGIVKGISETEFAPNTPITRQDIAVILHRYAVFKGYDVSAGENTNILSYEDAFDISEYAIPAIQWACGSGLIKGKTDSTINPTDYATRAEITTILQRFVESNS